jgi:hypothetical protein
MKVEMKSVKAENSKLSKKSSTVVKKKTCDSSTVTLEYFLTPTLASSSSLPSTPVFPESKYPIHQQQPGPQILKTMKILNWIQTRMFSM